LLILEEEEEEREKRKKSPVCYRCTRYLLGGYRNAV
jgi:hypothetical protein